MSFIVPSLWFIGLSTAFTLMSVKSLLIFSVLIFTGIKIALKSNNQFATFLAAGISAMFGFQILVNIGMNLGLAPITGIPLPFVSYGGSSLVTSFVALGLLESISYSAS